MAWYRCGGGGNKFLIVPLDFIQIKKKDDFTSLANDKGVLKVTYNTGSATGSGESGWGIFATSEFYDLSKYSHVMVTRQSVTSDTIGQKGQIFLLDENNAVTYLRVAAIPNDFTYETYAELTAKGKYRIGFQVNTGTYTYGYGTASGSITITDLRLA